MPSIAIGYNKQELNARINSVLNDTGNTATLENWAGLAFGRREVNTRVHFGGGTLIFSSDHTHVNPNVYLIYYDGNAFFRIPLNGHSTNFEFDTQIYSDFWFENFGFQFLRLHYLPQLPEDTNINQYLGESSHPTFATWGFTFFPRIYIRIFLSLYTEERLLLSGARIYFGKGLRVFDPREAFSLKLDVAPGSEISELDLVLHAHSVASSGGNGGLDRPSESMQQAINDLSSVLLTADNPLDLIRSENGHENTSTDSLILEAQRLIDIVENQFSAGGLIEDLNNRIDQLRRKFLAESSSVQDQSIVDVVRTIRATSVLIEPLQSSVNAIRSTLSQRLESNGNVSHAQQIETIFRQLQDIDQRLMEFRENHVKTSTGEMIRMTSSASSGAATDIGLPVAAAGPPCPPYWTPDY